MSSIDHDVDRASQQDARAWSAFTATKYTAAKRQIGSPFAQGFLGERVSARDLIAVLENHPMVGARGSNPILSDNGYHSDEPWMFNGETDFIELAMVIDMLRMFTPATSRAEAVVSSYSLKATAETFLSPHCSFVSNGRLIWAAAALGLALFEQARGGPNLLVGISEREHQYVRKMVDAGGVPPRGDQHQPPGLIHLKDALDRAATGAPAAPRWIRPVSEPVAAPFHDWLTSQSRRNDPVGDFARDYTAGVSDSDHRLARTPGELLSILLEVSPSLAAYDASVAAIAEWFVASPGAEPVRTELISRDSHDVGYGERSGDTELLRFRCPCGGSQIVEEHDNIPGFRSHDVSIDCGKCRNEWDFAPGRSVRRWGLIPISATP